MRRIPYNFFIRTKISLTTRGNDKLIDIMKILSFPLFNLIRIVSIHIHSFRRYYPQFHMFTIKMMILFENLVNWDIPFLDRL